jgi:uncharacterized protein with PhoU and TrkA domain
VAASLEIDGREDYRVMDVPISKGSELDGATVASPFIQERGLVVLKMRRGDEEIVRPDSSITLRAGDNLLCFGRSRELSAISSAAGTSNGSPRQDERGQRAELDPPEAARERPHRGPE